MSAPNAWRSWNKNKNWVKFPFTAKGNITQFRTSFEPAGAVLESAGGLELFDNVGCQYRRLFVDKVRVL
jgi:hypothetical protein